MVGAGEQNDGQCARGMDGLHAGLKHSRRGRAPSDEQKVSSRRLDLAGGVRKLLRRQRVWIQQDGPKRANTLSALQKAGFERADHFSSLAFTAPKKASIASGIHSGFFPDRKSVV